MRSRIPLPSASASALALALALSLVSRLPAKDDPGGKRPKAIASSFETLPTNHMLIQVKINGKGPFRMIFDVGSPLTLLGNKAAEESGVVKADSAKSILFNMRGEQVIDTLELGDGLKATRLPVVVMDHPFLKVMAKMLERRVDGLIGFTFFARYKTTIDYQARKVTFEPVDYKVADLARELPNRFRPGGVARKRTVSSSALWGLSFGEPQGEFPPGLPIRAVSAGSAAEAAGFQPGDVLADLDGRWTVSLIDAHAAASTVAPGTVVRATVLRQGRKVALQVVPRDGL